MFSIDTEILIGSAELMVRGFESMLFSMTA